MAAAGTRGRCGLRWLLTATGAHWIQKHINDVCVCVCVCVCVYVCVHACACVEGVGTYLGLKASPAMWTSESAWATKWATRAFSFPKSCTLICSGEGRGGTKTDLLPHYHGLL